MLYSLRILIRVKKKVQSTDVSVLYNQVSNIPSKSWCCNKIKKYNPIDRGIACSIKA